MSVSWCDNFPFPSKQIIFDAFFLAPKSYIHYILHYMREMGWEWQGMAWQYFHYALQCFCWKYTMTLYEGMQHLCVQECLTKNLCKMLAFLQPSVLGSKDTRNFTH